MEAELVVTELMETELAEAELAEAELLGLTRRLFSPNPSRRCPPSTRPRAPEPSFGTQGLVRV